MRQIWSFLPGVFFMSSALLGIWRGKIYSGRGSGTIFQSKDPFDFYKTVIYHSILGTIFTTTAVINLVHPHFGLLPQFPDPEGP
ncbi:MAG: hypothetical protein JWM68_1087 [Verrucomicrobiales bacterium]|nr:hypothetical protein [Verrucomicrobiales bacterium]